MDTNKSIIIGADIVPVDDLSESREYGMWHVTEELEAFLKSAVCIYNLECPIDDNPSPAVKYGPVLSATTKAFERTLVLNPSAYSLANNHILDQGSRGLESTIKTIKKYGISYFGCGESITSINKAFSVQLNKKLVIFYSCVEHEYSFADTRKAGANPFDYALAYKDISELKNSGNYLVVLYHGGKEKYPYPSPELQKRCRFLVDVGADLVVCQHSHCIGSEEHYHGALIVYGQGNAAFGNGNEELTGESLLIKLDDNGDLISISYTPIVNRNGSIGLAHEEANSIVGAYFERSKLIERKDFIYDQYNLFSKRNLTNYLINMQANPLMYRIIRKIFGDAALFKMFSNKRIRIMLNLIRCESHNELFCSGLEQMVEMRTRKENE